MDSIITYIPITKLTPGDIHPHLEFQQDNIDNLINSIKTVGLIEPLIVRKKDDNYEIINGNRRYNALKEIGIEKVPTIIVDVDDQKALNMIITNNIQRKELTSKEEAKLYEKALTFPNINLEQLSINLGIPIDRISSKLKTIKKTNNTTNQIINSNNKTLEPNSQNNNLINNDIINLEELDKNEIRRERLEMNDNQFMANNNIPEQNQEPTFGGRFFPSMDNLGENQNIQEQQNITNQNQLIDLTDQAQEQISTPEQTPMPNLDIPNLNTTPEQTPIPNLDIPNLNTTPEQTPMSNLDIPNLNTAPEPINTVINTNNIEIPTPTTVSEVTESTKNIQPVVDMIKNLVTNLEEFGYKLKLTEDETNEIYNIKIEVEK